MGAVVDVDVDEVDEADDVLSSIDIASPVAKYSCYGINKTRCYYLIFRFHYNLGFCNAIEIILKQFLPNNWFNH